MKIVDRFIRQSILFSGVFSFVSLFTISLLGTHHFVSGLSSEFTSSFERGKNTIARYYGNGDLLSLKAQLNLLATESLWSQAQLTDQSGDLVWSYTTNRPVLQLSLAKRLVWRVLRAFLDIQSQQTVPLLEIESTINKTSSFPIGHFVVHQDVTDRLSYQVSIALFSLGLILFFWGGYLALTYVFAHKTLKPIKLLQNDIQIEGRRVSINFDQLDDEDELKSIARWFSDLALTWQSTKNKLLHVEREAIQVRIAQQVAHDIRSPLAALASIDSDVAQLPERPRQIMRAAISRIQDIANNLISQNRASTIDPSDAPDVALTSLGLNASSLLSPLIDSLVSEKRLQFSQRSKAAIDYTASSDAFAVFARVAPSDLKRILSNLINNSVEAIPSDRDGRVHITLSRSAEYACLVVSDDGHGISADVLPKLLQRGSTHGKKEGSGLGLWHAKTTLEQSGGSIEIRSTHGQGTCVTLRIPIATPPEWFVSQIEIPLSTTVVIFDDEESIHQVWEKRLDGTSLNIKHFSSPGPYSDYLSGLSAEQMQNHLILSDYEISGIKTNGLDLVESLGAASRTILVTSHFEDADVQDRCKRGGVRLLPKSMTGMVPVNVRD